jgi:hypothetical protein
MAVNPHLSDTAANAAATAIAPLANSGKLRIYDGSQPANANAGIGAANMLAELTMNATAFGGAAAGVITANAITSANAALSGTATWFRIWKSDGTTSLADGTVGISGANLNLNSVAISAGASVSVTSLTLAITE